MGPAAVAYIHVLHIRGYISSETTDAWCSSLPVPYAHHGAGGNPDPMVDDGGGNPPFPILFPCTQRAHPTRLSQHVPLYMAGLRIVSYPGVHSRALFMMEPRPRRPPSGPGVTMHADLTQ